MPYTVNEDYELDARRGRIFILLGGDIDGDDLEITYDKSTANFRQVQTREDDNPEFWVEYRENARSGTDRDFIMPRCKLRPDGDFDLKSVDSHQQVPLQIDVLVPLNGAPAVQIIAPDEAPAPELDFTAGCGSVYIALLDEDGLPTEMRHLGDTESMNLTLSTEDLIAHTGDDQVRQQVINVVTAVTREGSILVNEPTEENLGLLLFGDATELAQTADTGIVETYANVRPGQVISLGATASNPAGALDVSNVVVEDDD